MEYFLIARTAVFVPDIFFKSKKIDKNEYLFQVSYRLCPFPPKFEKYQVEILTIQT